MSLPRECIILFGKNAPKIYARLSSDPTSVIQTAFEKDESLSEQKKIVPQLLTLSNQEMQYRLVFIDGECLPTRYKNFYAREILEVIESASVVVYCPESRKLLDKTKNEFVQFKKGLSLTDNLQKKRFDPHFLASTVARELSLEVFLNNCILLPSLFMSRYSPTHFRMTESKSTVAEVQNTSVIQPDTKENQLEPLQQNLFS